MSGFGRLWKLTVKPTWGGGVAEAKADPELLGKMVREVSKELSHKIMHCEEVLILQSMNTVSLELLIEHCRTELDRRKK